MVHTAPDEVVQRRLVSQPNPLAAVGRPAGTEPFERVEYDLLVVARGRIEH
jgi:hypothetical protein